MYCGAVCIYSSLFLDLGFVADFAILDILEKTEFPWHEKWTQTIILRKFYDALFF